jgi:hypothetical protein
MSAGDISFENEPDNDFVWNGYSIMDDHHLIHGSGPGSGSGSGSGSGPVAPLSNSYATSNADL